MAWLPLRSARYAEAGSLGLGGNDSCQTKPISGRSRRRGPLGVPPSGGSESLPAQPVPFRADREERGDSDCRTRLKAELRTEEPPGGVKRQTNPISKCPAGVRDQSCETNPISGGGHGLLKRAGCPCHDALAGTLQTHLVRERIVLGYELANPAFYRYSSAHLQYVVVRSAAQSAPAKAEEAISISGWELLRSARKDLRGTFMSFALV